MWNYIYYIGYLKEKEKSDLTGIESQVLQCLESKNLQRIKWFPMGRAIMIEENKGRV